MTDRTGFHGASFRLEGREVREFAEAALAAQAADPGVFSWIDLEGDAARLEGVLRALQVDPAVADRLGAPEILPGICERPNCIAFRLYEIDHPDRHLDTSLGPRALEVTRMLVVLGRSFVVTWHPRPLDIADETRAAAPDAFRLAGRTPGFIVFLLLQRCLYDYANLNLANDNTLDLLEPSAARGTRAALEADIGTAGGNILTLKKLTTNLQIICMLLATKRTPFVSDEARASFGDLQANAASVRAMVDSSRDLLDGVVGALQAEAAQRTSRIAGVLTIVSVIMLPLGLVAGLWGMNFEVLPMTKHEDGFWLLLGLMAVIAAALVLMFRRLGWIGAAAGPPQAGPGPGR